MEESSEQPSREIDCPSENVKKVLSFDIGIKNLAACCITMEENPAKILHWQIHSLMEETRKTKPSVTQLAERIFIELDTILEKIPDINVVLIENQPSRINGAMKSIQMIIFSYFLYKKHSGVVPCEVYLISANKKTLEHPFEIDTSGCKAKSRYVQTKYKSVKFTEQYIKDCPQLQTHLEAYKKKDDLCDALLQAIAWMRKNNVDCKCVIST